ncbi:MAG: hypothetical protein ACE5JH_00960 [Acidobacteriota bacterium]
MLLAPAAPKPVGRPAPSPPDVDPGGRRRGEQSGVGRRSGLPGASVINDLVEEIEKDQEAETVQHGPGGGPPPPAYAWTVACSFVPGDDQDPESEPEPHDASRR